MLPEKAGKGSCRQGRSASQWAPWAHTMKTFYVTVIGGPGGINAGAMLSQAGKTVTLIQEDPDCFGSEVVVVEALESLLPRRRTSRMRWFMGYSGTMPQEADVSDPVVSLRN